MSCCQENNSLRTVLSHTPSHFPELPLQLPRPSAHITGWDAQTPCTFRHLVDQMDLGVASAVHILVSALQRALYCTALATCLYTEVL